MAATASPRHATTTVTGNVSFQIPIYFLTFCRILNQIFQLNLLAFGNTPQYHKQLFFKARLLLLCLVIINVHHHHIMLFTPRKKPKTGTPVKAFQRVSINLRPNTHSRKDLPSQLILYAWMTVKNMTFYHNRPIFQQSAQSTRSIDFQEGINMILGIFSSFHLP